jgi:hypothetical protein
VPTKVIIDVSVPVSSVAQVQLPYFSLNALQVTESGKSIFAKGMISFPVSQDPPSYCQCYSYSFGVSTITQVHMYPE